ncbi:MAG TPA: hypothetical protein PK899_03730 [Spirochaetota bacterium]|nr:hypothetical protein [Spirochaetota bacterium]
MRQFISRSDAAYSSICVKLFVGERRGGYASHMCQIIRRGAARRLCVAYVSNYSSGSGEYV